MEFLAGLVIILVYFSPFIAVGILIFLCLAFISLLFAKVSLASSSARRKIIYLGLSASFVAAVILSVPVTLLFLYNYIEDKSRPEDEALARLKHEMRRDGRDQLWPAGTIASLEQWVNLEGGQFRDKLHLELANNIASRIDANTLETNAADFVLIEKLANRPHAIDSYSEYLIGSAVAYVHFKQNGFIDVGHPERFRRAPGQNLSVNHIDYNAYLKLLIVRCTRQPALTDCAGTFTEANISHFETMPDSANPLSWLERKELLPPLRAALGLPAANHN